MITKVEALRYRSLRYVSQELGQFHVLVGPNASGKTTFLDVISFLGDLVSSGIVEAVSKRTQNFQDLLWGKAGSAFELAVEARVAESARGGWAGDLIRYEVRIGHDVQQNQMTILAESVRLKHSRDHHLSSGVREDFPEHRVQPERLLHDSSDSQILMTRDHRGRTTLFIDEEKLEMIYEARFSALTSPIGSSPVIWLRSLLRDSVKGISLDGQAMRRASPPGRSSGFSSDGSNLPWIVAELLEKHPDQFHDWIAHLRTSLPDLVSVRVVDRADDRHRYLMLQYRGGLEVPSWMTSDGTLRMMALTLLSYLPGLDGVYLVEEPENGIHPRAVETVVRSLSHVYDAQVLLATHSPLILGLVEPSQLLCFAKDEEGATDIVRGDEHPMLREWERSTDLGLLFAAGVLG